MFGLARRRAMASVCVSIGLAVLLVSSAVHAQGVTALARTLEELSKVPEAAKILQAGSPDVARLLFRSNPGLYSDPDVLALVNGVTQYGGSNAVVRTLLASDEFKREFLDVASGIQLAELEKEIEQAARRACERAGPPPQTLLEQVRQASRVATLPVATETVQPYAELFRRHGIPMTTPSGQRAERVVMVSTHGYWGDPPPAGVPDTGGQTYWVLQMSKEWAKGGRQVLILARHFEGAPRVEQFGDNVWLVRLEAGGQEFIRKEDLYPLTPALAEEATAVASLFQAQGVFGHYADGMTIAAEVATRLELPLVQTSHSLGVAKMRRMDRSPTNPQDLLNPDLNYWIRNQLEDAAIRAANHRIANNPGEPTDWARDYNISSSSVPHTVFPGGAGQAFFDAASRPPNEALLAQFGLRDTRYIFFWGRMSEAKNIEGLAEILAEARQISPAMRDVKIVVAGGTPGIQSTGGEEAAVKARVREVMEQHGLTLSATTEETDLLFLGSQSHDTIADLARGAIAYVGPQRVEPFGMGAAEAMAAGVPILISREAGISRWLADGVNAYIIDPDAPRAAAEKLVTLATDEATRVAIAGRGQALAAENFSWSGLAGQQAAILDQLFQSGTTAAGRGFHRATPAWRGDLPQLAPHHFTAAEQLTPVLVSMAKQARERGERLVVAFGGESGSGKTEIAQLMTMVLPQHGVRGAVVPGDAFFRRAPADNHANRLAADARGSLSDGVGVHEVDMTLLDQILGQAKHRSVSMVTVPSDSRIIAGRRYEDVPIDLDGVDVVFVDLTYSMLLDNAGVKVFLERSSLDNIDHVRARNLARDPDQDFDFVQRVLEYEHTIIAPTSQGAALIVGKDDVLRAGPRLQSSALGEGLEPRRP